MATLTKLSFTGSVVYPKFLKHAELNCFLLMKLSSSKIFTQTETTRKDEEKTKSQTRIDVSQEKFIHQQNKTVVDN